MKHFYSILFFAAAFFVNLDAVDVAFTEAAVGAGISTVLMMGAIALTSQREKPGHTHPITGLVVISLVGAMLIYGTLDLPAFNSENPATRNDVYQEYVYGSVEKLHIPNMVTSVLASYRGYDTLGEVAVIFTAGVGVTMLLGSSLLRRRPRKAPSRDTSGRKPKERGNNAG